MGSRKWVVAVVVLSVLLLGALGTIGWMAATKPDPQTQTAQGPGIDRGNLANLAKRYGSMMGTYSADNYPAWDREMTKVSTPAFARSNLGEAAKSAQDGNAAAKGTSKASVKHAAVESVTDDTAKVLITLDQTVSSPELSDVFPNGKLVQSRVLVTLKKSQNNWLLDGFEFV